IDGLCVPAEVRENPLDRCGRLDAGNHTKAVAAAPARLDLDGKYSLEALRLRSGPVAGRGRRLRRTHWRRRRAFWAPPGPGPGSPARTRRGSRSDARGASARVRQVAR